ncbi:MAG: hypothetical protein J2P36_24275, partial [Ktedonobacteraceae bacterium]|nr:hypothetical protein [Ktedonobacteraceae bacterium]
GLSGKQPLVEALASYEQQRNEAAMPRYETNCQMASLEPPPAEMQPLFEALRCNQEATNRYLSTLAGTISPAEFFAPDNIAQIMNGAGPAA